MSITPNDLDQAILIMEEDKTIDSRQAEALTVFTDAIRTATDNREAGEAEGHRAHMAFLKTRLA